MTARDWSDWTPDPELLAAYFDGELTRDPELRARVADWLDRNPEARDELAAYRRLARLWHETTPEEPAPETWRRLAARVVAAVRSRRRSAPAVNRSAAALVAVAACVALGVGAWSWWRPAPGPPLTTAPAEDMVEVFPVATASEITILRVEGADTGTLAVGVLPVQGPLELAGPGEVVLTSVQPDARDQMTPRVVLHGPGPPMIWARLAPEDVEP